MKSIIVTRKKKFAGAVMQYWIITQKSKTAFMTEFRLDGDTCEMSEAGFPNKYLIYFDNGRISFQ